MLLSVRNLPQLRAITFVTMLLGFIFFLSSARAQSISVDCSDPSGSATVSWSGMNDTFQVNGSFPGAFTGQMTIAAGVTVVLSGQYTSVTQVLISPTTLDILDPVTNHIRGKLTVSGSDAGGGSGFENFSVSFTNDFPELLTAPLPSEATIVSTGSPQDVTVTFDLPSPLTISITGPGLTPPISSLGITGTSTNPSGATIQSVNTTTTAAVNTASGNDYATFSDLVVPGKGLRFSFIRAYNDQDTYSGPLGLGWTHSYNILLTQGTSGAVTIKEGDGHQKTFSLSGSNYVAPPGAFDVLASTGVNTWTLTRPTQTVLAFGPIPLNPSLVRLLSITDKNGNSQTLTYDANGNLLTFTDIGNGQYTFTYDGSNHLTSMTDVSLGHVYQYSVPASGGEASYTDDLGKTSTYSYSGGGLLSVATDAAGNPAIGNTFDGTGRVTQATRTIGATMCITTYSYDDANHITTITDPLGGVTKHYYDASKRLIKIVNALGFIRTFTYDANNNVLTVTNPLNQTTTYTYDVRGNRTSVIDPLNHSTLYTYDSKNNLTSQTDANGHASTFAYDLQSNLTKVTDALGGITNYSYDVRGNKLTFQNAKGNTTSDTYSLSNRILTATDPALKQTQFSYDAGGNTTSVAEPAGNSKSLAYDSLGHLTTVNYAIISPFASTAAVGYTYDPNGNRTQMTDGTGATSYVYDVLNRVTNITSPEGAVSYTYDCNDNRKSIVFAGKTVNFGYDAINRLTSVNDGGKVTSYTYDAANNVTKITYPTGAFVAYTYDAAGRITKVSNTYTGSVGNPVSSFSYLMDNVGNRTQVTSGDGTISAFVYDNLNRLLSGNVAGKVTNYTYDAVGNRISGAGATYTYDVADKLKTAGSTTYTYDANGNQISRTAKGSTTTFQYDAADRLVKVSGGGGPTSTFAYDGDGNRVSQNAGSGLYKYLNDIATGFATVLDETGPDGHIQYVRGRSLISADGSNFTYYYHYDAQNTVAGITNTANHLEQRYVYDVFGELQHSAPGNGSVQKYGYTGEALDPGTSLYFLRARYYDTSLGRFITKDPFNGFDRSPQTLNKFTYVRNNPATLTDRTGLCDDDDFFFFFWPCAPPLP